MWTAGPAVSCQLVTLEVAEAAEVANNTRSCFSQRVLLIHLMVQEAILFGLFNTAALD